MTGVIEKIREDRKFFMAAFMLLMFCGFLFGRYLDMVTFADLVKFTLGAYFVANAGQKIGLAWVGSKMETVA